MCMREGSDGVGEDGAAGKAFRERQIMDSGFH